MSASERLREVLRDLDEWGWWDDAGGYKRSAPLYNARWAIADVVEAAERVTALDFPATYIAEIDGVRHYGTSGDAARIIAPALTALQEALNGSAGDGGVT